MVPQIFGNPGAEVFLKANVASRDTYINDWVVVKQTQLWKARKWLQQAQTGLVQCQQQVQVQTQGHQGLGQHGGCNWIRHLHRRCV
ncbi:hypothetical protein A3A03_00280 [Candidatus Nomurabacteria bacterium RIFCSPLOWO2_01_FULL_40_18]|uniref:Uncharacterized protein n=1 Tax=Candidatus Nomurabacteria bacterium RIFCSPLOWO2_01_FULL_40_18 TaxID=1801773 RepID=A0A1F6XK24_9BACT|nr:MAG: hypothetical protein A3A03_00280 [Candidatus Nomurabacteria bacterium RIFCSPLOWO2_01_FULL_40_18]